ncbi:MAG: Hsp33 family molecular chaperone HslO [Puniceicoccaceae bacterium]
MDLHRYSALPYTRFMEKLTQPDSRMPNGFVVSNRFVRTRNVLISEMDASVLFENVAAHRVEHGIEVPANIAPLFDQLLAAFTLHAASRPRNEMVAWTLRYPTPVVSFFFAADAELGTVTGRFFQQHVKVAEMGEMHQELHRPNREPHLSMIEFSGSTAQSAIHQFYNVSEQRPARFFDLGNHRFALVSAHPDYDEGWFTHVDLQTVLQLDSTETVNLLETRTFYWSCGCTHEKIAALLAPMMKQDAESIFGDAEFADVNCPRCGATYSITRAELAQRAASLPESEDDADSRGN